MDEKNKLVSVLMPNYDYGRFIREAVHSVSEQEYSPIELMLIDDGSTDNSRIIIEDLAKDYNGRFQDFKTIFLKKNNGINAALNKGIEYVKGDFTIILDADDMLLPNYIPITVSLLTQLKSKNVGFVYTNPILIDEKGKELLIGLSCPFDKKLLESESYIPGCGTTLTEALKRAFPLDESIMITTKHKRWKDIVKAGYEGFYVGQPLFKYRMHKDNVSGIGKKIKKIIETGKEVNMVLLIDYWEANKP